MKREVVFTNAMIVTPREIFRGTLHVKEGIIANIDLTLSHLSNTINLGGDYLIPGLVELHTDQLENHGQPRPGVRWPSLAAILSHDAAIVAAGITTVFDALAIGDLVEDSPRIRGLQEMVETVGLAQRKALLRAEHLIHLRCEIGYPYTLETFEALVQNPLVKLVSLMDHTPGQRQFTSLKKMSQYYQGKFSLSDEEMITLIRTRQDRQRQFASRYRKAIVKICQDRHLPIASHDDTTTEHVAEAASEGVIISEFPTTLEAAQAARHFGLGILLGAPNLILGGSHSGNVSARELGKQRLLDILSSDYIPSSLIQGAFLLHQELGLPLPEAIATITLHPSRIINLGDRGALEIGKRADLVWVKWDSSMPIIQQVWREGQKIF